jgi:MFS superfamily sulfate permease-like transporter
MAWKVVSLLFLLIAVIFLPFWPYHRPWPPEANLFIVVFSVFVAILTFLVSIMARRGSDVWKGRGQG